MFRLAYIFRTPVHRILDEWPSWEVFAWESVFEVFGPLDWRRDDLKDARRHAFSYADQYQTIGEGVLFQEPEPPLTRMEQRDRDIAEALRQVENFCNNTKEGDNNAAIDRNTEGEYRGTGCETLQNNEGDGRSLR